MSFHPILSACVKIEKHPLKKRKRKLDSLQLFLKPRLSLLSGFHFHNRMAICFIGVQKNRLYLSILPQQTVEIKVGRIKGQRAERKAKYGYTYCLYRAHYFCVN